MALDALGGSVNGPGGPIPPTSYGISDGLPYTGPSGRDSNLSSVIRVWRAGDAGRDQNSKLVLLPRKQTTALDATRLALEEFGIPEDDLDLYCLYHVSRSSLLICSSRSLILMSILITYLLVLYYSGIKPVTLKPRI